MWKNLFPAFLLACAVLTGCAAKTEVSYQKPQSYPFDNSMVYDTGLKTVWGATLESIEKSSFALDQARKDTRTITLSFTVDTPSAYVDCGVLTYATDGEAVSIEGAAAEARYMYADGNSQPKEFVRRTALEGTAALVFSAEGQKMTRVTVNTRYTVGVVNKGNVPVTYGYSEGFMPFSVDTPIVFSGGQTGRMYGGGLTQCVSTSALEKEILVGIRAALKNRP